MGSARTDLAAESRPLWGRKKGSPLPPGIRSERGELEGFALHRVDVLDEQGARAMGRPVGQYVTLELEGVLRREEDAFRRGVQAVAQLLAPLLPEGPVLVVGLGNRAVTPDRIGPLTVQNLLVTRHLVGNEVPQFGHLRPVAAITPGVLGETGVESSLLAQAVVSALRPAALIAVDALAARSVERLCRTVQLTDTGIIPGSGVGNHRRGLTRDTLGIPVIGLGVPTVVDGETLARDLVGGEAPLGRELFVTPREVDSRVADFGKVLGRAVTLALNPTLSLEDLELLLA